MSKSRRRFALAVAGVPLLILAIALLGPSIKPAGYLFHFAVFAYWACATYAVISAYRRTVPEPSLLRVSGTAVALAVALVLCAILVAFAAQLVLAFGWV